MRKTVYILFPALLCAMLLSSCKSKEKLNLSSIHTTAAVESGAEETKEISIPSTQSPDNGTDSKGETANLTTDTVTYASGGISVEYPVLKQLTDTAKQEKINSLLKDNALAIIKAWEIDEATDSLSVQCKVMSLDRKRLTAVYTGTYKAKDAAHPVNVFYTSTVDLSQASDIGFHDYSDAYTMATYTLSEDCRFYNVSPDLEKELMSYKNTQSIEYYTALYEHADFPLETASETGKAIFAESFSYEHRGNIYFSIPVPHALGDYAIIQYTPDTK